MAVIRVLNGSNDNTVGASVDELRKRVLTSLEVKCRQQAGKRLSFQNTMFWDNAYKPLCIVKINSS